MSEVLSGISPALLKMLADGLEGGRFSAPYRSLSLSGVVGPSQSDVVATELERIAASGFEPLQLALLIRAIANEREISRRVAGNIELVWSGPEVQGATSRDTAVVVRELFSTALSSVLVTGYAVYQGKRVFETLAENMDRNTNLRVQLFLNVHRSITDDRSDAELLREFADSFLRDQWPGRRPPEVYYDPRALSRATGPRACLHAKCIVVDQERAFVTSANLTEAAQERNIEAGILLTSSHLAQSLIDQFEALKDHELLKRVLGTAW